MVIDGRPDRADLLITDDSPEGQERLQSWAVRMAAAGHATAEDVTVLASGELFGYMTQGDLRVATGEHAEAALALHAGGL